MGTVDLERDGGFQAFLGRFDVKLVVLSGQTAGNQVPIEAERLTLGRGPGVDCSFDDQAMSRQHAIVEFGAEGFRIRDLGSTNGILLNGEPVQSAELSHGDRLDIGSLEFQVVVEKRTAEPEAYELPADV